MSQLWPGVYSSVYKSLTLHLRRYKLRQLIGHQTPLKIVVGASGIYEAGWIPTEVATLNLLRPDDWAYYFSKSPIDAIVAEHVWEHLTEKEGIVAATNCHNYLKIGGYLRVAVPDGFHPNREYINRVRPGGAGPGADDHRVLYNHLSFREVFKKVGFQVELLEYFDEHGQFHFQDWDPLDGMIRRSRSHDSRNKEGILNYTSLILDAKKAL